MFVKFMKFMKSFGLPKISLYCTGMYTEFLTGGGETLKLKKNTAELIVAHALYKRNFNVVSNAFCNTNNS